jgi:glycosyltransferase involved in cell wall biosynthesis
MKIIAVVPCLNEEKFIENVVAKTNQYVDEVIVADDNSTDKTVELADNCGAYVLTHKSKRGAGQNTWMGIKEALLHDADIIVTLDGDGQHRPEEIPLLVKPILDDKADFVLGTRFINYRSMPVYRRLGISTITAAFNVIGASRVSDAQSCFRAYRRVIFDKIKITEVGFAFSIETLVKIRQSGFRFAEVPINVIYHKELSQNSSQHPVKHGVDMLLAVCKWRVKCEL